jgi:two-component system, chemotaxis family, protein-glutamate methylesterase/glutaminase
MLNATHGAVEAIVVGASAGGVSALVKLLPQIGLPDGPPVIIVVHVPSRGDSALASVFGRCCAVPVSEARDKVAVGRGAIWLAPAGYHLLVEQDRHFALSVDDPVSSSRPSIDVLFESAAEVYGAALIGIVLTGANADGARGARAIREKGGLIAAQDPEEAEAKEMPRSTIAAADPQFIGPLDAIAGYVRARLQEAS